MWSLENVIVVVRKLAFDLRVAGWCIGVCGSTLVKGISRKDADIILFPSNANHRDVDAAKSVLNKHGMICIFDEAFIKEQWRKKGSDDTKHVEAWSFVKNHPFEGRRIDVFFMLG